MLVLFHVITALVSIVYTAFTYLLPSKAKLHLASGLIAATILSGVYLIITTHTSLMSVCFTGLAYIGGMLAALIASQRKLARQDIEI